MTILDIIDDTGRNIKESKIIYEMDFANEKEFSFTLQNTSEDDEIQDLRILTNMSEESYKIIELTENILPLHKGEFRIRIFRKPLLESVKKQRRVTEFAYTRKMVIF